NHSFNDIVDDPIDWCVITREFCRPVPDFATIPPSDARDLCRLRGHDDSVDEARFSGGPNCPRDQRFTEERFDVFTRDTLGISSRGHDRKDIPLQRLYPTAKIMPIVFPSVNTRGISSAVGMKNSALSNTSSTSRSKSSRANSCRWYGLASFGPDL